MLVIEAVIHLNQYQQDWLVYRSTAESLKHEKFLYLARAGAYAGLDDARAHALLARVRRDDRLAGAREVGFHAPRIARTARRRGFVGAVRSSAAGALGAFVTLEYHRLAASFDWRREWCRPACRRNTRPVVTTRVRTCRSTGAIRGRSHERHDRSGTGWLRQRGGGSALSAGRAAEVDLRLLRAPGPGQGSTNR